MGLEFTHALVLEGLHLSGEGVDGRLVGGCLGLRNMSIAPVDTADETVAACLGTAGGDGRPRRRLAARARSCESRSISLRISNHSLPTVIMGFKGEAPAKRNRCR